MDSIIAIKGSNFVIVAADSHTYSSITKMRDNEDKILVLDNNKLIGCSGSIADKKQFGDYIKCNVDLYKLRNGIELGTAATASFTRTELARLLREDMHSVRMIIAGYNTDEGSQLLWMDELASLANVDKAAHGYGGLLVTGLLDRHYHDKLSKDEALEILIKCSYELKNRFLLSQYNFIVKIVDKDGVKVLNIINGELVGKL